MSPKVEEYMKVYEKFITGPRGPENDKLLQQGVEMMREMSTPERIEAVKILLAQATHPYEIANYTEALKLLETKLAEEDNQLLN